MNHGENGYKKKRLDWYAFRILIIVVDVVGTPVPEDVHKDKHFWSLSLTNIETITALVIALVIITTVNIKANVMLVDVIKVNINVKYTYNINIEDYSK